ncbi:hypothetical protein Poli38472_005734 [Pythium oligandrum]|uniref:RING-type E3 ubiquitin transferase n=1 Tax=Pythium oligandrum TaxID=41045 RepID=A0A8K1FMI0_PYTOL|nr:hypothetical protein Poli38472_005734 [Pythium oligandrum]|eukprot:TMW68266.1 hypothetical protein Poli38472_005734 [Pythium oligandrum]
MAGPSAPPCSFYAQGKCRNGHACKFYHAEREELAVSPLPCKFFLQNACKAGRECKFSHVLEADAELLTTTAAGERKVTPGSFNKRCKFHDYGGCAAGNTCPYLHIDDGGAKRSPLVQPRASPKTTVKMHVLKPKAKQGESGSATHQSVHSGSDQQVKEMSEFISKEEELYYYGAPGDFDLAADDAHLEGKPSYAEIAGKNVVEDLDAPTYEQPAGPRTCTYFLQGLCRYGDSCFYSHTLETSPVPVDEFALVQEELANSTDLECGICYDNVIEKGERFGLLSGCTHPFCLSCVRNWRGNADQPKQTVRQCPVCRIETHFVVPSNRMIVDPERKQDLVKRYINNLASIPCRHFDEGRGTCPFGTSCFYAHRLPDGTEEVRQLRTAVDAEGQYDVLRQVRLEHYFQNLDI